ncbi:hypothetical protein [Nocardia salmonicida]|uniref:hypothetical protein n=1 Tax=Nocardia salmonicida TaxID=53431 RepID=UPI0037B43A5D
MVRRLLLAVLPLLLIGCGGEVAPAATPMGPWSAPDPEGWEVLRKLRHVDTCAVLGRAELTEVGPVLQENPTDLDRCEYQLTSWEQADQTLVMVAITTGSARARDGETSRVESGATVLARTSTERRDPVLPLMGGICTLRAVFPSTAMLVLTVRTRTRPILVRSPITCSALPCNAFGSRT